MHSLAHIGLCLPANQCRVSVGLLVDSLGFVLNGPDLPLDLGIDNGQVLHKHLCLCVLSFDDLCEETGPQFRWQSDLLQLEVPARGRGGEGEGLTK